MARGASVSAKVYASEGATLVHYDLDVAQARLSRQAAVSLPAAVQAGWLLLWATVASQFAPGPRCEYVTLSRRPTRGEAELVRARSS